jgi:hypothetical protein
MSIKRSDVKLGIAGHTCNSSYLGGRSRRIMSSRLVWSNVARLLQTIKKGVGAELK